MKTLCLRMLAVVIFVAVLSSPGIVFSQMNDAKAAPEQKKDHKAPPPVPAEGTVAKPLPNLVKLSRADDETQKIAAEALREQPSRSVRSIRAAYFAPILTDPQYRFRRWSLEILEAKDTAGTKTVKVRVTPVITAGASATVLGALDETYELKGKSLKLLKSESSYGSLAVGVLID